ncbi:hypothetical protein ACPV5O_24385 [Vibrio maritimus]|uniref:hypothetical protein n=1 Tax=Vibrio maritimus TaxID=990268 RepID=UPI0040685183
MDIRINAQQKNALLMIHFVELKMGTHTPVNTGYLRKQVGFSLSKELHRNHFSVGLNKLVENGYLVVQPNTNKQLNVRARDNEMMWQLTQKGRIYAETLHSARLRPKRSYTKSKKS